MARVRTGIAGPGPPHQANPLKESFQMATKAPQQQNGEKDKAASDQAAATKVRWNTQSLKSSYANFCNATSTREEVVLNFGVSHNWERTPQDMEIELSHRIVLSPFAAKRLSGILAKLIGEYESRYGELKQ
jgi:hypothetical protein